VSNAHLVMFAFHYFFNFLFVIGAREKEEYSNIPEKWEC